MYLKLFVCVCVFLSPVRSQRAWGSSGGGGYNSGFSNSWNGGFSNNRPSVGSVNGGGSWGSNGFGGQQSSLSGQSSNLGYVTSSNSGKNTGWQNEKLSAITNLPSSGNYFPSNEGNRFPTNSGKQTNTQNTKQEQWYSKNPSGNQPKENEIPTDYEDNYPSWGSNNKKKTKPTSNTSGNWETTTQRNNKSPGTQPNNNNNNNKPQKPSNGWNSGDSQTGKEPTGNTSGQNEKPSTLDTSILDELDKNDWYFGKESDYPQPPFRSTLNIDVSQLWNFDKNKNRNPNQNSRGTSNNNYNNNSKNNNNNSNNKSNNNNNSNSNNSKNNNNINTTNNNKNNNNSNKNKFNNNQNDNRRWNRQIEGRGNIQCECVHVNLCDEEDMIVTQQDVRYDLRPLQDFRCEKLTEVCCTNPKLNLASRANLEDKKEPLRCGERRIGGKSFAEFGENIAEPGEFPWNLRLENAEINCSASLIHRRMAVTAAHCIAGALPGELVLKAGVWNTKDEPSQSRQVTKIIPHPDYSSRNPRNDIALLVLETPFQLTDNVNTICLPVTNDKWDSSECVVAGWRPEEVQGQILEVLEKGVVNFLPQPECQNIMLVTDLWRNYILHDSFVCGLEKNGRKSCTGEEGGFVICPSRKRADTYIQIGIVSKGMNCDDFGRPGLFTNVLAFLDWINKTYFDLGLFEEIDIRGMMTP